MIRRLLLLAAALFAAVPPAPIARAGRATVFVAVEDPQGVPVPRLAADTFSVLVDGVVQPIESVAPANEPLTVILLVDDSPSMKLLGGGLGGAAREFVASLDAADRWRTGEFADRILFSRAFAPGRSPFRLEPREPMAVRERAVRGGSPLWDGLHHAVELLAGQPGRRSLVVFTDGRASGNDYSLDEVAEFSVDTAASLSAIMPVRSVGIRQNKETVAVISPEANLDRLARYTGGLLVGGYDSKEDPLKRLRSLAVRLRTGYSVSFAVPNPDGRRHRLDVRVATAGLHVRAPMAFRPD